MAMTRKMLKAMGIEDEKIDQIIEAHSETVEALKTERDEFKEKSSKLESVQKELDEAQTTIEKSDNDAFKVKYEAVKEEFDKYKNEITENQAKEEKLNAFKSLLKTAGISEKRIDSVVKVSSDTIEKIELDDGKIKNAEDITKSVKEEWADFIPTIEEKGAKVTNPPEKNEPAKDPFLEGFEG